MEEKVLIKGVLKGDIIPTIIYILAATVFGVLSIVDLTTLEEGFLIVIGFFCAIVLVSVGKFMSFLLKKRELIVTNKKVIVRGAFGFRADLPMEKITNVSMRWFGGMGCGTPSLKIMMYFCANKQDVFDTIISETLQRDSKYQ